MAIKRQYCSEAACVGTKRARVEKSGKRVIQANAEKQSFDSLPTDVLPLVLASLAKTASSPSDFCAAAMSSKAMREASRDPQVLANLDPSALSCSADSFSPAYHAFLRQCADAGNVEASFLLGMIDFYCLRNRKDGVKALVKAAKAGHAEALYSLSVIHFNGSGSTVQERKLSVGVLLCASAAQQGHVQALRELGHCFQDGYGIKKNTAEGRRLLMEANLREFLAQHSAALQNKECCSADALEQVQRLETVLQAARSTAPQLVADGAQPQALESKESSGRVSSGHSAQTSGMRVEVPTQGFDVSSLSFLQSMCHCLQPLLSDCGSMAPGLPVTHVQAFLLRWQELHGTQWNLEGLKQCANSICGRIETRAREFRCCALCSKPSYCSRACQAADWRLGHMSVCQVLEQ